MKNDTLQRQRIDKWLWAARFYKARSVAADEIGLGRVMIEGQSVKSAREIKVGDFVSIRQGFITRVVEVKGLSKVRGSASIAQQLYEETPESVLAREQTIAARKLASEPAHTLAHGRPTKRDRRVLQEHRQRDWDDRWLAGL